MTAYLAGPINGCTDEEAFGWRREATCLLGGDVLDPMARDYRGVEDQSVAEIVEGDKADIDACSVVLVHHPKSSTGTDMEIMYAYMMGKPVIAVVPSSATVSPWLRYHATRLVSTLEEGAAAVREVTA